jgi:hypothetical protein
VVLGRDLHREIESLESKRHPLRRGRRHDTAVVQAAPLRVAQRFEGRRDLVEARARVAIAGVDPRVTPAREAPIGPAYVGQVGVALESQNRVEIQD